MAFIFQNSLHQLRVITGLRIYYYSVNNFIWCTTNIINFFCQLSEIVDWFRPTATAAQEPNSYETDIIVWLTASKFLALPVSDCFRRNWRSAFPLSGGVHAVPVSVGYGSPEVIRPTPKSIIKIKIFWWNASDRKDANHGPIDDQAACTRWFLIGHLHLFW